METKFVRTYVRGFFIVGHGRESHPLHLAIVFKRLQKHGIWVDI